MTGRRGIKFPISQGHLPAPVIARDGLATISFQHCTKRLCRVLLRFLQLQP